MKDKTFVDSNIWLYLLGNIQDKKQKAIQLLQENHYISTQVLAENANVCRRKFLLDLPTTDQHLRNLISCCKVVLIQPETILQAGSISYKYQLGFYDSLVVSTALENGCSVLYSEGLQDEQIIEGKLTIKNPFK